MFERVLQRMRTLVRESQCGSLTMVCDVCGKKGARMRRLTRGFGKGKTAFLIEGVPVISCPHCGESYLTAATLREIERIKLHRRQLTEDRVVAVARFGGAA